MPLRIALEAADPERRELLSGLLAKAGHAVVAHADGADARLVDLPSSGVVRPTGTPLLVLTDQPGLGSDAAIPGVLRRGASERALDAGLRAVAAGLRVRERAPAEPAGFAATTDDPAPGLLTPREMEILSAIGDGLSNKAVARRLAISAHTVKFHLEAIFAKLEANSRAEAVAKGLRQGLIEL